MPYPQALSKPRAKVSEFDDHLLEAFQKVTITIPLVDAINNIPSYAKFLKGICTPHISPKRIQLNENISPIMMNPDKKERSRSAHDHEQNRRDDFHQILVRYRS